MMFSEKTIKFFKTHLMSVAVLSVQASKKYRGFLKIGRFSNKLIRAYRKEKNISKL